jgi:PAS domain S-box-containing protein
VSGGIGEDTAVAMMKAGAHDFVMKDKLARLIVAIEREMREARIRQEKKRTEEALQESEARYRALFEQSADGVLIADLETKGFKYANPAICRMLGYTEEELRTMDVAAIHPKADLPVIVAEFEAKAHGDKMLAARLPCIRKDGTIVYADVVGDVMTIDGRACSVGFFRDITERMKEESQREAAQEAIQSSLREKEVMLREIHHRVKNNMQVISSLFNLQAGHTLSPESREILKKAQTRIRSMSLVHEKLYKSRNLSKIDLAGYIQSLAVHLLHVYLVDHEQVRLETEFEDVALDINSAIPCGLILNELISNALKHAFPNGRTGVIRIGLRRGTGGAVELRVADDGVGFPPESDFREAESFGLQIVNLLVHQLEAAIDLDRTNGAAFTVTFRELKYAPRI